MMLTTHIESSCWQALWCVVLTRSACVNKEHCAFVEYFAPLDQTGENCFDYSFFYRIKTELFHHNR